MLFIEYSFGYHSSSETGVFAMIPQRAPGVKFRFFSFLLQSLLIEESIVIKAI